jgi:hypothetical protein
MKNRKGREKHKESRKREYTMQVPIPRVCYELHKEDPTGTERLLRTALDTGMLVHQTFMAISPKCSPEEYASLDASLTPDDLRLLWKIHTSIARLLVMRGDATVMPTDGEIAEA